MVARKPFKLAALVGASMLLCTGRVALASEWLAPAEYQLACIRVNDQDTTRPSQYDTRVNVYSLDENCQPLGPALELTNAWVVQITADGRMIRESRIKKGSAYRLFCSETLHREWIETMRMRATEVDFNSAFPVALFLDENVARKSVQDYLEKHSLFDPAVHQKLGWTMLSIGMEVSNARISPSRKMAVMDVTINDKDSSPRDKYAPVFSVLFLVDFATSAIHHIVGSDQDRYFVRGQGDVLGDKRVTFYRIRNFWSIMAGTLEKTPELVAEGGWEVCCYDIAKKQLKVLVKSDFRWGTYSQSPLLWSPDGTKLLYEGCYEPSGLDPANNEQPGVYVYDVAGGSWERLTNKHQREYAICWAPDSRRFLIQVFPNRLRPQDANDKGFHIVDLARRDVSFVLALDEGAKSPEGYYDFRFSFRWSPDGKYIAFVAKFEEGGDEYEGVFILPVEGGPCELIDKARIQPRVEGKRTIRDYFRNLVWLQN